MNYSASRIGASSGWTNPYVTDGLIAMWDGEWNAGGGIHDPNATVWKDLSGNGYDFVLPDSGASFSSNCLNLIATSISAALPEVSRHTFTIECVAESTGYQGAWVWIKNPTSDVGALLGLQSPGIVYFPWYNIGRTGNQNLSSVSLTWTPTQQAMYKNGIIFATSTEELDSRNVMSEIYIGRYRNATKATMSGYSIRLYSHSLYADEIAYNYSIDKIRFNLP